MEQNYFDSDRDVSLLKQKWRSHSNTVPENKSKSENENGSFDCNICLDSANEPVVTLCGHLYCWPCIYKWLQVQTNSEEPESRNCPVCKAQISHASLVPLYGRGSPQSEPSKPNPGLVVPRRPPPSSAHFPPRPSPRSSFLHHGPAHLSRHYHLGGGAVMTSNLISPTVGVFGEMVLTRMFGGSGSGGLLPPLNPVAGMVAGGTGSPRMRRQEVQVDKSLNRVSIFLFCCIILCLLLF